MRRRAPDRRPVVLRSITWLRFSPPRVASSMIAASSSAHEPLTCDEQAMFGISFQVSANVSMVGR